MKKWLMTIFVLVVLAAGAAHGSIITFENIADGLPGSMTTPAEVGSFIDVYITVNTNFVAADVVISVAGAAEIVSATGIANAADFGWDALTSNDPIFSTNNVEIGLATVIGNYKSAGQAAKITLKALNAGTVVLSIANGNAFENYSMDAFFGKPRVEGSLAIYQTAPEPVTVALLFLGALLCKKRI